MCVMAPVACDLMLLDLYNSSSHQSAENFPGQASAHGRVCGGIDEPQRPTSRKQTGGVPYLVPYLALSSWWAVQSVTAVQEERGAGVGSGGLSAGRGRCLSSVFPSALAKPWPPGQCARMYVRMDGWMDVRTYVCVRACV